MSSRKSVDSEVSRLSISFQSRTLIPSCLTLAVTVVEFDMYVLKWTYTPRVN